jgi:isopentenyl phosphate kinase
MESRVYDLVFLKLGGSLITDKTRPYTPRQDRVRRLADEIRRALEERADLRLLIGHGSGSFGHQAAAPYGTRVGVRTPEQWRGYAEVAAAAARLNRVVTDALLEARIPVLSLQPSASALSRDGVLVHLDTGPIEDALARGLVPLVYGDVSVDEVRGGTIVSTEDLFVYLAERLPPRRVLLAGETPGVLDDRGAVVLHISPVTLPSIRPMLSGSRGVDVTGGMADKVTRMVRLVERQPGVVVHILSGLEADLVRRALVNRDLSPGTRIAAL